VASASGGGTQLFATIPLTSEPAPATTPLEKEHRRE